MPAADTGERSTLLATLRFIATQRSAIHLLLGGSVATFWSWGLMWWTPAFLQRSHHLSVAQAGQLLGPMHLIAGTLGTLLAGWLVGRRAAADPRYVTRLLAGVTALTTIPSILLYWVPSPRLRRCCCGSSCRRCTSTSVRSWDCCRTSFRRTCAPRPARSCCFSPTSPTSYSRRGIVGGLSDWFAASFGAGAESLRWALLLLAPTGLWAAWHLWTSGATIREDEARVS